jgi:hypothetical protein
MKYQPPCTINPTILNLVVEIAETIGRYTVLAEQNLTPRLRRENRIRTIQASLAIENNTLTLEQVTAVIEGKRVLGHPREIQEVRNAFATYEAMEEWEASSEEDLLAAHELLMRGLVDETGRYRSGGVGIFRGEQLVHMAPPADRVPKLMADLLATTPDPAQLEASVGLPAGGDGDSRTAGGLLPRTRGGRPAGRRHPFFRVHAQRTARCPPRGRGHRPSRRPSNRPSSGIDQGDWHRRIGQQRFDAGCSAD